MEDISSNWGPSPPKSAVQQSISCTHCRQRKIKCEKLHPCSGCKRSGLACTFPKRARHTKKQRNGPKASNNELLRRLNRMEQLIGKMEGEGKSATEHEAMGEPQPKEANTNSIKAPESSNQLNISNNGVGCADDSLNRYIGSTFWRTLTSEVGVLIPKRKSCFKFDSAELIRLLLEVEGLRQIMEDESDVEDNSPNSMPSVSDPYVPHSSIMFRSTVQSPKDLRLLHPSPTYISMLCTFYIRNVDPMFKILHIPTLQDIVTGAIANVDGIPSGNYVEALLFAMYYAAVTTLSHEACLRHFKEGKNTLLAQYRAGTEAALSSADFLNSTELGTLQALTILLLSVRSNDDTQFGWTMTGVAIRLGHSLGLHREEAGSGMSPFEQELRRRLWWQLIALDGRCCEDRASDPGIIESTFNTKKPLNINDSDMNPHSVQPLIERVGPTEMTKTRLTHEISFLACRFDYHPPTKEGQIPAPRLTFEEKMTMLKEVERRLDEEIIVHCDPKIPIHWVISVVARLIMCRLRLSIYHPLQYDNQSLTRPQISKETLLSTAVETMELAHLLDTHQAASQWTWFFKTYVQWHALAATLTELCVQTQGPLVERAWRIIDMIFDDWAARIADSPNGMLWRPIKKLKSKAAGKRLKPRINTQDIGPLQQQSLPIFGSPVITGLQDPSTTNMTSFAHSAPAPTHPYTLDKSSALRDQIPSNGFSFFNVNDSSGSINWAEWDAFMQDFQMEDRTAQTEMIGVQREADPLGAGW